MKYRYYERNNRSAIVNKDTIDEKLKGWLQGGYVVEVSDKPFCCNPLSVVVKTDPDSGQVKKRLVLDMSRHVNDRLAPHSLRLDDSHATEKGAILKKILLSEIRLSWIKFRTLNHMNTREI
jgi:hypothetical protein